MRSSPSHEVFVRHLLIASALCLAAPLAAQEVVPSAQLLDAMKAAVRTHAVANKWSVGGVDIKEFRILKLRPNYRNGQTLADSSRLVWAGEVTPMLNCSSTPSTRTRTVTATTRDETTVSSAQRISASVSVEVGASAGVVSGSVAATLAGEVERGQSVTRGQEKTVSDRYTKELGPRSGVRVGFTGFVTIYNSAPFEADLEITKAMIAGVPPVKTYLLYPGQVALTTSGSFTGRYWSGALGMAEVDMTDAEVAQACATPNAPTSGAVVGVRASSRAGMTGAQALVEVPASARQIKPARKP